MNVRKTALLLSLLVAPCVSNLQANEACKTKASQSCKTVRNLSKLAVGAGIFYLMLKKYPTKNSISDEFVKTGLKVIGGVVFVEGLKDLVKSIYNGTWDAVEGAVHDALPCHDDNVVA